MSRIFFDNRKFFKFFSKKCFSSLNTTKINLTINMPDSTIKEIELEENHRLVDLETEIKKSSFIQKVEFKSWDYCNISKQNEIKSCLDHPLYLKVDKMEWQYLNKTPLNSEIQELLNSFKDNNNDNIDVFENHLIRQMIYKDYKDIEIKLKQILLKFNKSINQDKLFEMAIRLYSMKNFYINEKEGKHIDKNLNEIFEDYYNSKEELDKMNQIMKKLEKKAYFKAKLFILIAPIIFFIQLLLIYFGTFQVYSWDIMEPMTYLLSILNLVGILIIRKKLGQNTAHRYYTNFFFKKLLRKRKFDEKKYEFLDKKVEKYEKNLN